MHNFKLFSSDKYSRAHAHHPSLVTITIGSISNFLSEKRDASSTGGLVVLTIKFYCLELYG